MRFTGLMAGSASLTAMVIPTTAVIPITALITTVLRPGAGTETSIIRASDFMSTTVTTAHIAGTAISSATGASGGRPGKAGRVRLPRTRTGADSIVRAITATENI